MIDRIRTMLAVGGVLALAVLGAFVPEGKALACPDQSVASVGRPAPGVDICRGWADDTPPSPPQP